MTMCEAVSDRMPAVAAGQGDWTAEERAHLASCSDCGAEWTLVSMASNLGRDVTLETGTLTTLVLKQVRAAKSKETRQRWVRQSIIAVGGLAIAAAALTVTANSLLSTTSNTPGQPLPVIRLNELPTGPQHSHGPHPYTKDHLAPPPASGRIH